MKFSMIILAAGLSKRMGVPKPLLPVGDVNALVRTIQMAKIAGISDIVVVTGHKFKEIETQLTTSEIENITVVHNDFYQDGMFSSVKTGILSLPSGIDGAFLFPVDYCGVKPETLKKLMTAFSQTNGSLVLYPTYLGKHGHPPLIPKRFASEIPAFEGSGGLRGYLYLCPFKNIDVNDSGILLDMDTPKDYAKLLNHLGISTYPDANQCEELFLKYETPTEIVTHGREVAALSMQIANLLKQKGVNINADLLYAASLLHDIQRMKPNHEHEGMCLLLQEGYPEAATLVGAHMDLPEGLCDSTLETVILFLADKLHRRGNLCSVQKTLEGHRLRFKDDPDALFRAQKRMDCAQSILDMLENRYEISFSDISSIS